MRIDNVVGIGVKDGWLTVEVLGMEQKMRNEAEPRFLVTLADKCIITVLDAETVNIDSE